MSVPHDPVLWSGDRNPQVFGAAGSTETIAKQASVIQLIRAYRVRGHLLADIDPLGYQPGTHPELELADYGLRANDMVTKFAIDSLWDRPTHPEGWYFRSDHVPYAQANVPSLYFSSLPHPLYHTPKDDPDHINYAKLTKMAQWMSATGWLVANAPERVKLLPK